MDSLLLGILAKGWDDVFYIVNASNDGARVEDGLALTVLFVWHPRLVLSHIQIHRLLVIYSAFVTLIDV